MKKRSEFLKMEKVEMQWIVDGVIPMMSKPIMISGCPGSGKSLLGYQLASNVAYGTDFLGNRTQKHNTLYISYEDDAAELAYRSQKSEKKINPAGVDGDCYIMTVDYNYELTTIAGGKIKKGKDYDSLVQDVKDNAIRLIVIDHLSKIYTGDENNRNQVNDFGNWLSQLCTDTGAMVVILAHTNKTDNQYSGSSANAGIYRMVFLLSSRKTGERTLSLIKSNCTHNIEPMQFIIDDDLYCSRLEQKAPEPQHIDLVVGKIYTREDICNLAGQEMSTRTFAAYAAANNLIKQPQRKKIKGVLKTVYVKGE